MQTIAQQCCQCTCSHARGVVNLEGDKSKEQATQPAPETVNEALYYRHSSKRRTWTPDSDKKLSNLVKLIGPNWSVVAHRFPYGLTTKMVKERWTNHLDPRLKRTPWTPEEDQELIELIRKHGRKWCEISKLMDGRSELMVKNRFYGSLLRRYQPHYFSNNTELSQN